MVSTDATTTSRRGRLVVATISVAAFGPYLASGVRTEQVAVYGTFALLLMSPTWIRVRPSIHGWAVAGLWCILTAIATAGAVQPAANGTRYLPGSTFAGMDNVLLPLAVMATMWLLLSAGADRDRLLRPVCGITVWAMAVNAVLAVMSFAGHSPNLDVFYNGDNAESVSFRASTMGRFSGAVNQPAEAGLLYSIALLAAIFLYRQRAVLLSVAATLLAIGGILTVSKIFLIIGAPVAAWQLVTATGGRRRRFAALAGMFLLFAAVVRSGTLPAWTGQEFLLRLLPGTGQDAVTLYTAGRLGDTSTLAGVTDAVLRTAPLFGFGSPGLRVPYDNAWVEALVVSGLVGGIVFTAVLTVLCLAWWNARGRLDASQWRFAGGIVVVLVGACGGVPALTANRCATIVWTLLTLLLLARRDATEAGPPSDVVGEEVALRPGARA